MSRYFSVMGSCMARLQILDKDGKTRRAGWRTAISAVLDARKTAFD